jgi:hypothetical protein
MGMMSREEAARRRHAEECPSVPAAAAGPPVPSRLAGPLRSRGETEEGGKRGAGGGAARRPRARSLLRGEVRPLVGDLQDAAAAEAPPGVGQPTLASLVG